MESKFVLPTDQHELNLCKSLPTDHLFLFGPMKYTRETSQEHKLEPLGLKCVMPGIAQKNLSGIFEVLKAQTRRNAVGHSMSWHPETRASFGNEATELRRPGMFGGWRRLPKANTHHFLASSS